RAMTLGQTPGISTAKIQLLKQCILKRTAEVILAFGYEPEEQLRQIRPERGPDAAQLLAMEALVLSKGGPEDIARLSGKITSSLEATFLCWASRDSLVEHMLEQWQWLKPARYDDITELDAGALRKRGGLLYANWKNGMGAPEGLTKREWPSNT